MVVTLSRSPRTRVVRRTNECLNPSFETDTSSWSAYNYGAGGAGTFARVTSQYLRGTAAGQMSWTTAPTVENDMGIQHSRISWPAGVTKNISAWVRAAWDGPVLMIYVRFFDTYGAVMTARYSDTKPTLQANVWTLLSGQFTAPSGAVTADIRISTEKGGVKPPVGWLGFDAILVETVAPGAPQGAYFDGTVGAGVQTGDAVAWSGSTNVSQSTYSVSDPNAELKPTLVLGYDDEAAPPMFAHQLMSGATVATYTAAQAPERSGTLHLLFADQASAHAARQGLLQPGTWWFHDDDNPEADMTFAVVGPVRRYQSDSRSTWLVDVPIAELS